MKKTKKQKMRRRNAASGAIAAAPRRPGARRLSPRRPRVAPAPELETVLAAVAGGGGGAVLGGYLAGERGWNPKAVGAGLGILGTLGAMKLGGGWRVGSMGVAAAGAGQAALALLDDEDYTGAKEKKPPEKPAATKEAPVNGVRQARHGGEGLDRAFNRVRERLHRIYEDDDAERFVDEEVAA